MAGPPLNPSPDEKKRINRAPSPTKWGRAGVGAAPRFNARRECSGLTPIRPSATFPRSAGEGANAIGCTPYFFPRHGRALPPCMPPLPAVERAKGRASPPPRLCGPMSASVGLWMRDFAGRLAALPYLRWPS